MPRHVLFQVAVMSLLSGVAIVAVMVAGQRSDSNDHPGRAVSDVPPTPVVGRGDQVVALARLDEASLTCRVGRFHVAVTMGGKVPPETQLVVMPLSGPGPHSSNSVFYSPAGESVRGTLFSNDGGGEAWLSPGVELVGYDKLSVAIGGVTNDGYPHSSNAVLIDAPPMPCD